MDIINVERWDVMSEFHRDLHDVYYHEKVTRNCWFQLNFPTKFKEKKNLIIYLQ